MTEYLTTTEAAAIIRKSADYVARQCKAGQIKAKKLGNDWRIERIALDAFMSGGKAAPTRTRLTARQQRRAAT
jgi:excisionase family DNA binding protein